MAYKQPSSGLPFKQLGSSPVKQKPGFDILGYPTAKSIASGNVKGNIVYGTKIDHVKRATNVIHSGEKSIIESKKALNKSIKKVKGKTVNIKISDIKKQLKSIGSKIKLSDVKKSLTKSMKLAGKRATFIPSLFLGATTTATADQPTYKSTGDPRYKKGESQQIKDLLTKHKLKGGNN